MNNKTIDRILIGSISTLSVLIIVLVILILKEASPVTYDDIPQQSEVVEEVSIVEMENESEEEQQTEEKKKMVEVTTRVNIRGTDSEDGKVLETVEEGATFDFVEVLGNGWTHIIYDGQDAYVNSKYVKLVDAESEKKEE